MNAASPINGMIAGARISADSARAMMLKNKTVAESEADVVEDDKADQKLWKAARGFEEIFIHNMLKEMRSTTFASEDSLDSSNASQIYISMLDEQISKIASEDGRFGLSKMIHDSLAKNLADSPNDPDGKTSNIRHYYTPLLDYKENSNKENNCEK